MYSYFVRCWICFICLAFFSIESSAQDNSLSFAQFLDIVRKYHPVAMQANLSVDSSTANLLSNRGAFDPQLSVNNEQKSFDGKTYFFYTNPQVKIPAWYGIDFKVGLENNGGSRLQEESTAGKSSYAGFSIPLINGLAVDQRRSVIEQAKILVKQSEELRRNSFNDLLFEASKAYWTWVREYEIFELTKKTVEINRKRLDLVKRSFAGGERAAIDTTEAITQLQNFLVLQAEANMRWMDAGYSLSNFLWLENMEPFRLPTTIVPDSAWRSFNLDAFAPAPIEKAVELTSTNHPKLLSLDYKKRVLDIERKLKFQYLLPKLNFNYNFLSSGYQPFKNIGSNLFENNYKYGVEFGLPIFQRQARGEYKIAKIKIDQVILERKRTAFEIENKLRSYHNQTEILRQQVRLYETLYDNLIKLLKAEETRFSIGESSLFLINNREQKVMETQQKQIELRTKFLISIAAIQWAMGGL